MTKPNSKTKKKNTSAEAVIEEILQKDKKSLRVTSSLRAGKPPIHCHGECAQC
jgi:hypothetical protein